MSCHRRFVLLSLLQLCLVQASESEVAPFLVPLTQEEVPVTRDGKVIAFKTTYSGLMNVGHKDGQEFRVIFDTGSGHVIVPSVECVSETCLLHRRYNVQNSPTAVPVNVDASPVPADELCDQVTIGFGTGSVVGEFVKEKVCVGGCVDMIIVSAVEMSEQPFKSFVFDGIVGLGLKQLSLSPAFSFLHAMQHSGRVPHAQFGVFMTETGDGESSELAMGGTNPARYQAPLLWAKVANPHLGHWQVTVRAFRIGNHTIGNCGNGNCHAILDTGTSHFGVPSELEREVDELLSLPATEDTKCRSLVGLTVEMDIDDFTITLPSSNYMRKLPLHSNDIAPPVINGDAAAEEALAALDDPLECKPKLMGVTLPPPMAPQLFILGEPVLHRFYTAYDWSRTIPEIGFALRKPAVKPLPPAPAPPVEVTEYIMLAQESVTVIPGEL